MWTNVFFTSLNGLFSSENWMYRLPPALFNLSLTASFVILAVLVARLLLRKTPRVYSYALWAVVAFRLICPISFSSSFSLLNAFDAPVTETGTVEYVPVDIVHTAFPSVDLMVPEINETINKQLPQGAEQLVADPLESPAAFATGIWLIGVAILLIWALSSYLSLCKKMRTAVLLEGNVFQSDLVCSPFILGFFRPKIYIPFGLDDSSLRYVLAHERYHIKRLDHIVKVFAFAILVIHWFNPLCWLAFHLMCKDMEMSCDEKVISADNNSKTEYSTILLSFAANRRFPSPSPLAFGETSAKSRIKNALKWKQPKVWVTALAVVLCIVVIAACAANPAENEPTDIEINDPYDWTSTVEHDDIYDVSVQLLNTEAPATLNLSSDGIRDLITRLNAISPNDIYTGRGSPAQLKVVITLAGGTPVILHYGGGYVEFSHPDLTDDKIWMIQDIELIGRMSDWLAQMQQGYNNAVSSQAGANTAYAGAMWEYTPSLSSRYPAFPFRFNFPYTHIRATCTNGTLAVREPDGETFGHRQSLKFTAGQTVYWEPYYHQRIYLEPVSDELVASTTVISFTVYNDEEILHTGNLQVSQIERDSNSGSYFYSASLTDCDGLVLTQADDNWGGGWISEPSYVYDLSQTDSVTLLASALSNYRFRTDSSTLFVEFLWTTSFGTLFPLTVDLYATDSEDPFYSFSLNNAHMRSFSFSGLTPDENREYYFVVDIPVDLYITVSEGPVH